MATFKPLFSQDIKTSRSFLNQLVDVIQEDISGSSTRKSRYQVFVTGGIGPGVTSSLYHTIHDQAFSLQVANPMFDMTVGLHQEGDTVTDALQSTDSFGKLLFASSSLMMREKIDVYKQFSQTLLGSATDRFVAPVNSTSTSDQIDEALFICFKRLFARDQIKRETFAMKFFQSGSATIGAFEPDGSTPHTAVDEPNLFKTSISGSTIFVDVGSSTNKLTLQGGNVGNIVDASDTSRTVGLLFYDRAVAVFDLAKITSGSQQMSGSISAMHTDGAVIMGSSDGNPNAKFIPDFMVSGSIDNIVDHIASTRFSSGSQVAMTFQNVTNVNSSLIFCNASADEFNYSSNPTFTDASNRIVVIDEGQEDTQNTFTFITTVGLYDDNNNLLAVAKLSRPVEKNEEKAITLRLRLDY